MAEVSNESLGTLSFTVAVRSGYAKFFVFAGRASRAEYWWFYLFSVLVGVVTEITMQVFDEDHILMVLLLLSDFVLVMPPFLSLSFRRLHDIGRKGIWTLTPLCPLLFCIVFFDFDLSEIGWLFLIITVLTFLLILTWHCLPGDVNANEYGPPRKWTHRSSSLTAEEHKPKTAEFRRPISGEPLEGFDQVNTELGTYRGHFHNGLFEGQGTFQYSNGDVYEGEFHLGKRHGNGKYSYRNGTVSEGTYENGKKVSYE